MFNSECKTQLLDIQQAYLALPFYKRLWLHLCSWSLARALSKINPETTTKDDVYHLFQSYINAWFFNTAYGILSNFGITPLCQSVLPDTENILKKTEKWTLKGPEYPLKNWGFARKEKNTVLAAVRVQGGAFVDASSALKNDKEIVMAAVSQHGGLIRYASDALKHDREVVMAAVSNYGPTLQEVLDEFKNDKEIVMAAVNNRGWALQFAPDKFKNDKEVIMTAVKQYGSALQFAADEFKTDKAVVMAAVNCDGEALNFASDALKHDSEVVMAAINNDGGALEFAPDEFKNDKAVVMAAVNNYGGALMFAPDELKNDKEVVIAAVSNQGWALAYAADAFKHDNEVIMLAIQNHHDAFRHVIRPLQLNPAFILEACKKNHGVIGYIRYDLITTAMLETAIKQCCQKDGRFLMTSNNQDVIDYLFDLFQTYPVRQVCFKQHSSHDSHGVFLNWTKRVSLQSLQGTSLIHISETCDSFRQPALLPEAIQKVLKDNYLNQQECVQSMGQGFFSVNCRRIERASLTGNTVHPTLPWKIVANIMSFLPYFLTSSGFISGERLLDRHPESTYKDIDTLIPALSLFHAAYALAEKHHPTRVEELNDDTPEAESTRPSAP